MRTSGREPAVAALLAVVLAAGPAGAASNRNGTSFRAVGWFKGRSTVSATSITCEIPTVTSAIADGAFAMGMWNTYGTQTIYFPDINLPFSNPCGGWIQLRNNLIDQAIVVERVALRYNIRGARRFRQFVPTRNGWPVACNYVRRAELFVGDVVNPVNSTQDNSGSGAPNTTFIQLLPLVEPEVFHCLRRQYAPLSTNILASLPLVITATAFGTSDAGGSYQANTVRYTLNLRHLCGNGRVDDGEFCDPDAPSTCAGFCKLAQGETTGTCSHDEGIGCRTDNDCLGFCMPQNDPSECVCVY
jgi:hypothetical protein